MKESLKKAIEKARIKNTKPLKNKKITKEFSYVFGVLLGDGHISNRRITLSATDKDFVENFKFNLEAWSKYKSRFYSRSIRTDKKIKKRKLQWACYLDSIEIEKFIKNFNINKINSKSKKSNFLKGFFDAEGSFSKDYELIAYNTNLKLLELVSKFLADLSLKNQIKTYTVKNINGIKIQYHYLKVTGESRLRFYQKIGFSIQRKQEKLMSWAQKIGLRKYGGI